MDNTLLARIALTLAKAEGKENTLNDEPHRLKAGFMVRLELHGIAPAQSAATYLKLHEVMEDGGFSREFVVGGWKHEFPTGTYFHPVGSTTEQVLAAARKAARQLVSHDSFTVFIAETTEILASGLKRSRV